MQRAVLHKPEVMFSPDPCIKHKERFENICHSLRKGRQGLQKLQAEFDWHDALYKGVSPVMQMAMEGRHQVVEMVLDQFPALKSSVIEAYARVGNEDKVRKYVNSEVLKTAALEGYAYGGYDAQVESLLAEGADIRYAILGYAKSGAVTKTYDLLQRPGGSLFYGEAGQGFAFARLHREVGRIIDSRHTETFKSRYMHYALIGYFESALFHDEYATLEMLYHTSDFSREYYAGTASLNNKDLNTDDLLAKIKRIRRYADKYDLKFRPAYLLQREGVHEFILKTDKLGKLSHNQTLLLLSKAFGLTYADTKKLYETVCKKTYAQSSELLVANHTSSYFLKRFTKDKQVRLVRRKRERDPNFERYENQQHKAQNELDDKYDGKKERRIGNKR